MVNPRSSLFLFIGNDLFSKDNAVKELTASILGNSPKDLDLKVFYGQESKTGEVLEYITTAPFLAPKRVAILKNFEKLPADFRKILSGYLKNPSKTTCLILETAEDSVPEGYDFLLGSFNVQKFGEISDESLASWVNKFLKSAGKTIEEEAVKDLKELAGKDLLLISQELNKLVSFTGDRREIKAGDVTEVVGKSLMASAFDLTWSIGKKDIAGSLQIVSDSILSGGRPQETIGLLCWHLKRILRAKALQSDGVSEYNIARDLKMRKKDRDKFFAQAGTFEIDRIKTMMSILLEADLDLKRTKYDPNLILEFAVMKLCLN